MPNIADADIPITDIRPSETGVESTARAGLRLGAYGNQIAQSQERTGQILGNAAKNGVEAADNFVTHQQINAGAQHGEQLFANLTDSWNKTANGADPHDPSTAAKWREEQLEPALQQFTSGFYTEKGQEWAHQRAEQIRSHMYAKSEADMSTLAKDAVVSTVRTLQNTGSNTVFKDPSALSAQFGNLDHSIDGILSANPNLKGADAAAVRLDVAEKTKEQYVRAAIQGAIVNGGDWQKIANDPKYSPYVNGTEMKQFEQQQKYYQKGQEVAARTELLQQHQLAEDQAHKAINDSYTKNVTIGDDGKVNIDPQFVRDMNKLPFLYRNAPGAAQEATRWISYAQREQKPETDARISNETYVGILRDMRNTDLSNPDAQKKILDQAWDARLADPGKPGSMSEKDFNSLRTEIADRKTPQGEALAKDRDLFFKRFSLQFDPNAGQNVKTAGNGYLAEQAARQKEIEVQKAGGDPKSVYDPNSPNFFGTAANINKYKVPLQDQLRALPSANQPSPPTAPANARQTVTSKAQYDALPSGANFVDDKGRRFVKP